MFGLLKKKFEQAYTYQYRRQVQLIHNRKGTRWHSTVNPMSSWYLFLLTPRDVQYGGVTAHLRIPFHLRSAYKFGVRIILHTWIGKNAKGIRAVDRNRHLQIAVLLYQNISGGPTNHSKGHKGWSGGRILTLLSQCKLVNKITKQNPLTPPVKRKQGKWSLCLPQ